MNNAINRMLFFPQHKAKPLQKTKTSSQYVAFACSSVDGQLARVAGHVRVGAVLQKQLDTVQVSRPGCVIKDRVSVAGPGVHVSAWWRAETNSAPSNEGENDADLMCMNGLPCCMSMSTASVLPCSAAVPRGVTP